MALPIPALLRNPILEREFVAFCRTKRWFILRSALVLLLVLVLWVFLGIASAGMRDGDLDKVGKLLFAACVFAQVIFIAFLTPGLIADLIVSERRKETLEILLVSPLKPSGIVLGKILSRLILIAAMVAASFPVVSVSLLFGGVRIEQVIGLFMVTLGTMLFAAGPAIFFSSFTRKLGSAAVLSYVVPFVFCVVLPISLYASGMDDDKALGVLARTHVLFAATSVAVEDVYLHFVGEALSPALGMLLFGTFVAALGTLGAILRLRRDRGTAGFAGGAVSRKRQVERDLAALRDRVLAIQLRATTEEDRQKLSGVLRDINASIARIRHAEQSAPLKTTGLGRGTPDFLPMIREMEERILALDMPEKKTMVAAARKVRTGRRRMLFRRMRNPILWKEANLVSASYSRVLFYIVLGLLLAGELLFLAVVPAHDLSDEPGAHIILLGVQALLLLVLLSANAASCIVGEREQQTLDLLRVTLIKPGQIVAGKVVGSLRSIAVLTLVPVLHIALFIPVSRLNVASALAFCIVFAVMAVFTAVHGVRFSIAARRPALAILLSMGLLALLIFVVPIVIGVMMFAAGGPEDFFYFLSFSNPMLLIVYPLVFLTNSGGGGSEDNLLMVYTAFWVLAYAGASVVRYALLASAYRRSIANDT